MAALPVEVLLGIYLGLLVGVIPALIAWAMGFGFKYVTGVTLPGFGVTIVAIALAGVNGGLLALTDKAVTQNPNAPRLITAIVVVAMLSMYAHSKGDTTGATFPRRLSLSGLRERTLALDLADVLPDRNEVRIRVVGEVADVEGYPPLPEELREELRAAEFTLPAALRIRDLEERFADRLETTYDLGDVDVTIDEGGRASVSAAPAFSGLSKRVGEGRQAVSVDALVPTGLARGDEVTCVTPAAEVRGTVLSARSGDGAPDPLEHADDPALEEGTIAPPVRAPTTAGGEGRVTVAVARADVEPLLQADRATVVVQSRGTRREYEAISLLRRADRRFERLTVGADSPLAGSTLGDAAVRRTYEVAVLAIRGRDGWDVAPGGEASVEAGDELFVTGRRAALTHFEEAVA